MKIIALTIIIIFICFILYEAYIYYTKLKSKKAEYENLNKKLNAVKKNYEELQSKLNFYAHTANLLKEVRTKFNFKLPGENLLIIVPPNPNQTTTKQNSY